MYVHSLSFKQTVFMQRGDEFYCHGHNFGSMNCSRYFRVKISYSIGYAYNSVYRTLIPLFVSTKDTMVYRGYSVVTFEN